MSMKITQEYMDSNVINPMAKRLAELEKKIDKILQYNVNFDNEIFDGLKRIEDKNKLALDNSKFLVEQFDKVIKNIKKEK